jgi:cobalt-zinc-cadmium efflux system outer membrane protein
LVLLCLFWSGLAFASGPVTLDQYLAEVRAAYPSLAAQKARAEAAESRVSPNGAWDDPFFAMGIDQIPQRGEDTTSVWRYQLTQTIPFPGKRGSKREAAEDRANGAKADIESLEREITLIATQLFYRAFFLDASIRTNESLRKVLESSVTTNQARYKTGGSSHHEWLLAKADLAVLNVEKLRLEREQKQTLARINEMRGQPADAAFGSPKATFDGTKKIDSDLREQPELKAFDAAVAAAGAEESAAKFAYAPDFVVQGMLMKPHAMVPEGMTSSMPASNWGFMVGVNVPLFFAWKQAPLVSAARLDKEAASLERQSLENRLHTEVVDAREQYRTAQSVVELYKNSVIPNTKLAAENARTAYAAKRFPLAQYLEVLKAERTQDLELLAAKIDVEIAASRLENLLSAPPISRFAPSRPSLFGGMGQGGMSEMPEATSMGPGTIAPKKPQAVPKEPGAGGGMGGM